GPYRKDGPDMLVGFAEGWRVSWDCARGLTTPEIFEDNVKAWSGDHCIDPKVVPGILLSNMKLNDEDPNLMDLAPTTLELFGIRPPAHMVGKSLLKDAS
ncbi:MAG: nucleotide pyrophosphatase, partial [bacterium]|nr:nucleotide pyrophosphatase [bacterium]